MSTALMVHRSDVSLVIHRVVLLPNTGCNSHVINQMAKLSVTKRLDDSWQLNPRAI